MIHVSKDSKGMNPLYSIGKYDTKKIAKKAMMDEASKDLTQGKYYFYELEEHKFITHEIYPST